jgi:hypothetical protein
MDSECGYSSPLQESRCHCVVHPASRLSDSSAGECVHGLLVWSLHAGRCVAAAGSRRQPQRPRQPHDLPPPCSSAARPPGRRFPPSSSRRKHAAAPSRGGQCTVQCSGVWGQGLSAVLLGSRGGCCCCGPLWAVSPACGCCKRQTRHGESVLRPFHVLLNTRFMSVNLASSYTAAA